MAEHRDEEAAFRARQKRRFPLHACELPATPDRVFPTLPPNAAVWERARRGIQYLFVAWRASHTLRTMRLSNLQIEFEQVMKELHNFMRQRQLPAHLRQKMLLYYDHTFQGRYVHPRAVLAQMPQSMRDAIKAACCMRVLSTSPLFRSLPKSFSRALVECLKEEVYLPHDVVYACGSEPTAVFFMNSGTVAVLAKTGEEIGHLEDGACFGMVEILAYRGGRALSIVAVEMSEIFLLSRRDFRRLLEQFPGVYQRLRVAALNRAAELLEWGEYSRYHRDEDDDEVAGEASSEADT